MTKRTHIDHLLARKAISRRLYKALKAEEAQRRQATELWAASLTLAAIIKAKRIQEGD